MKKNVLIMILAATLALSSCADQPPIQATTASWQVGAVDSRTEASTTSEAQIPVTETTTADTTTVNAAIPEGENIHPFSARTDGKIDCYFTLSYREDAKKIDTIAFHVVTGEEAPIAWQFRFTERTDFLFVRRTDRKTGGYRFLYVYETYESFDNGTEMFRCASGARWFNSEPSSGIGLTNIEDWYATDISFDEKHIARQLASWRHSYLNHCYSAEDVFFFDREVYQYDILYGFVDCVEYVMEEDVVTLPEVPFRLPLEYGAEKYW